ncbi:MAG: hypothetical protein DID90_2727552661 [Candidatus Nitrotoga sp. LAW]|nr:MAG: hypothetical protein DID90_2727552661 [Candidatus Nitrotoga sp. LAW]
MADLTTWVDVADSAVKIGLGALIGGTFGVWVAWLNNSIQAKKALNERRRQIIELVIESVDSACNAASLYWSNLGNGVYKRDKGEKLTDADKAQLDSLQSKFFESFTVLNSSGAKLLLLGENDAETQLQELRTALDAFFKIANIDGKKCTSDALASHKEAISTKRRIFYSTLSNAYARSV